MKAAFVLSAALLFTAQAVVAHPGVFTDDCGSATFQCFNGSEQCGEVNAVLEKVNGVCSNTAKHAILQKIKCNSFHPICCSGAKCSVKPKTAPSSGGYYTTAHKK
jgi:hypothetical protein